LECLCLNDPANFQLVHRNQKQFTIYATATKLVIDLVRPDIDLVKQALIQIHEKRARDKEKKDQL